MKTPLPYIIFETTHNCNLHCRYCYNHWNATHDALSLNPQYSESLRTLKKLLTIADVTHITFTGGEPFLSQRFLELVLFCRMKEIGVTVISNGNAGTLETYRHLVALGVGTVEFPLHSADAPVHDRMTGVNGSWSRSVQSIREVIGLKGKVVAVVVLTKLNCAGIAKTLHYVKSIGVKRVMLARFNIGGRGIRYREELLPGTNELKAAFSAANEYAAINTVQISSNVCVPFCVINPVRYPNISISSCSNAIANRPITLDPRGDIRLCNHSPVVVGNIYHDSLAKMFGSEYVQSWSSAKPKYCRDCESWEGCLGGCRAASEQMGLGLDHEDPIVGLMKHAVVAVEN